MSQDAALPEDTLDATGAPGATDDRDVSWTPPDAPVGSLAVGTTAREQTEGESIEDRIAQEEPDPHTAYGAPENESGLDEAPLGGDDPDAIDPEEDVLGVSDDADLGPVDEELTDPAAGDPV